MRLLYDRLELGGFDEALPGVRKYLAEHVGYQTNRYPSLTPELRAEIARRWGTVIERYGYSRALGRVQRPSRRFQSRKGLECDGQTKPSQTGGLSGSGLL